VGEVEIGLLPELRGAHLRRGFVSREVKRVRGDDNNGVRTRCQVVRALQIRQSGPASSSLPPFGPIGLLDSKAKRQTPLRAVARPLSLLTDDTNERLLAWVKTFVNQTLANAVGACVRKRGYDV
jgi:hypothetical protein